MLENAAESPASSAPPENENVLFPERNRGAKGVYCKWQAHKPYKAMEMGFLPSRGAPWFPVRMIHPLAARYYDTLTPIRKL
jgi:hypothetical protein